VNLAPARFILPLAWPSPAVTAAGTLTAAAALVNQLVKAHREQSLSRMLSKQSLVVTGCCSRDTGSPDTHPPAATVFFMGDPITANGDDHFELM
jgi:hypothetical protein